MSIVVKGGVSGYLAEVDIDGNQHVNLPTSVSKAGFVVGAVENDSGSVTGNRWILNKQLSESRRLKVGQDTVLFNEYFPGTALNTTLYNFTSTTMSFAQAGGFLTLNSAGITTINTFAQMRTYKYFSLLAGGSFIYESLMQFPSSPIPNSVTEWGAFNSTGTGTPTDGMFFRFTSTGTFVCVVNDGGTEYTSPTLNFTNLVGINVTNKFQISMSEDSINFWINGAIVTQVDRTKVSLPFTNGGVVALTCRVYNTGVAPSSAPQLKIALLNARQDDISEGHTVPHLMAERGGVASQGQTGMTMGSTAFFPAKNTPLTASALSNTVNNFSNGLGGWYAINPTLAVNNDGIVGAFQVPTTANKTLFITGMKITGIVTTVFAGGPLIGLWSLAYGHTSVSLATTEGQGTKAPRREHLGQTYFQATAPVGTRDNEVVVNFKTPIPVNPGEWVSPVLRNVGTVTTAGVVTVGVFFDGYWR